MSILTRAQYICQLNNNLNLDMVDMTDAKGENDKNASVVKSTFVCFNVTYLL